MKKVFVIAAIMLFGCCVMAQQSRLVNAIRNGVQHNSTMRVISPKNELQSPPFFTEDFSAGIPAGWTNVDNSGNGVLWRTTTTGALNTISPVDEQLNPVGTSALNGYLILDSDSAGGLNENSDITTVAINCSAHANVHLAFNQYFAQYGSSTGIVKVSNDNVNWTDVHHAETGLATDSGTANPYAVDIDISAQAANQATVYIRFNYKGTFDYWWFVDDVQLYEASAIDLSAYSIEKLNIEYNTIPLSQATALSLAAEIKNVGVNSTSGGSALLELVDVGNAVTVFSENISLSSLAPGSTQTVVPSSAFAPLAAGTYKSRVTVSLAGDVNNANDILESDPIAVSDSIYQRDDGVFADVLGVGAGQGEDGMAGQNFMVNNTTDLTSVTFFLKDTFNFAVAGTPVYFTIHPQQFDSIAPDGSTTLGTSESLLIMPGMIPPGGAYYTVAMQNGSVHLVPGLYFIGFHEVDSILPMGYSHQIFTSNTVWAHWNSGGWVKPEDLGFFVSYMIRANFGIVPDYVAELQNPNALMLYPNPSPGIFNMNVGKDAIGDIVEVFNVIGECVYQSSLGSIGPIHLDLSGLSEGLYSVHLTGSGHSSVGKICIDRK